MISCQALIPWLGLIGSSIIESISQSADVSSGAPPRYWTNVAHELFTSVFELHEQITAFITTRSQEEGFPPEIVSDLTNLHPQTDVNLSIGLLRLHLRISCCLFAEVATA
jgi:hypothetical protein